MGDHHRHQRPDSDFERAHPTGTKMPVNQMESRCFCVMFDISVVDSQETSTGAYWLTGERETPAT
jgi:hypothetical protein